MKNYDSIEYISYDDYIGNVVRCDLNGKNKKVLLKNQRIKGYVDKITSSYITYKNYDTNKTYKIKYWYGFLEMLDAYKNEIWK